jgi:hypothetical protein
MVERAVAPNEDSHALQRSVWILPRLALVCDVQQPIQAEHVILIDLTVRGVTCAFHRPAGGHPSNHDAYKRRD